MFSCSVSWSDETLYEEVIHLLVWGMLTCGRGLGSEDSDNSCGENLLVSGCTCTKQTFWTENQLIVTTSWGTRDREKRVPVQMLLWGSYKGSNLSSGDTYRLVILRFWSTKEETHMCPRHNWLLKFGNMGGLMSCVEKELKLTANKYEEY